MKKKNIAIFSSSIAIFNNRKIFLLAQVHKGRDYFSQLKQSRERENAKLGIKYTHHIQPLPNATPFPQNQGDFPYHRILQRNDGLEEAFIVDLAGLQMHVRAREDPLHRAILGREASVPAWNCVENPGKFSKIEINRFKDLLNDLSLNHTIECLMCVSLISFSRQHHS